jgi:hypothetical protein
VPGGFPRHTHNPREELRLEQRPAESKENLCKLVTVTGQTKSGKTVLAKQVFPSGDAIWIDGGRVSIEDDFWQVVIDALELFQTTSKQSGDATIGKIGAKGKRISYWRRAPVRYRRGFRKLGARVTQPARPSPHELLL